MILRAALLSAVCSALKISYTSEFSLSYADHGTGSHKDLSVWSPTLPSESNSDDAKGVWYSIGHFGVSSYSTPNVNFAMIQPDSAADIALPINMSRNWNDAGSHGSQDGSLYTPVCPPGFAALGSVAIYKSDSTLAKPSDFPSLRCVASKFTMPYTGAALKEVWDCKNSATKCRGNYDVSE
jgi:hypothetical protein